ncbi:uncharacterized protein LOC126979404 [Leptidea sinapis]|uniref:uncharacterized protein LOC126979404 n=1 Tax=Leptidea sinapis TaxID=189913 RepID=UPI0021370EBD|nr:uncharacterized protein LOC126979404 [Leptidea sinapis]
MIWNQYVLLVFLIYLQCALLKSHRSGSSDTENEIMDTVKQGEIVQLDIKRPTEQDTSFEEEEHDASREEEEKDVTSVQDIDNETSKVSENEYDETTNTPSPFSNEKDEATDSPSDNEDDVSSNIPSHNEDEETTDIPGSNEEANESEKKYLNSPCWITLDAYRFLYAMDKLDAKYDGVRKKLDAMATKSNFDDEMKSMIEKTKGAAERTSYKFRSQRGVIPAGINLGGYCMMRMPKNIMFFHRVKLRNDTFFRLNYIKNDLKNLVLHARLSLNDLHLYGSYDRTVTDSEPSNLFYVPTFGQAEILLKNVKFNMEGRYRLLQNRLHLVSVISEVNMEDILMTYRSKNTSTPAIQLQKKNLEGCLGRLKTDLNEWLKDYFNDYLMYFGLDAKTSYKDFQEYNIKKTTLMNTFTDQSINLIIRKLHQAKVGSVKLPKFTIYTVNGMQIHLRDGVLRGLDSMYRRSVATGTKDRNIYKVDADIGFSDVKVIYSYDALLSTGVPALSGNLILTADEVIAHMAVSMVKDPQTVDLKFLYLKQAKPEALTIEGPANRMLTHFKFLLERHIIAIMTNILVHNINMLDTVTRCVPIFAPYNDPEVIEHENLVVSSREAGRRRKD